jgi:hypothetical protein
MRVQALPPSPHRDGAPPSLAPAPDQHRLDLDRPCERGSFLPLVAMAAFSWLIIVACVLAIMGAIP